jgi:hypothetical protein
VGLGLDEGLGLGEGLGLDEELVLGLGPGDDGHQILNQSQCFHIKIPIKTALTNTQNAILIIIIVLLLDFFISGSIIN